MVIKPTVGRVVWYYPNLFDPGAPNEPLAAIIAHVHSDNNINVMVIDPNGGTYGRTGVHLADGLEMNLPSPHCAWMPFQKGQALKTEAAEARMISAETDAASLRAVQPQMQCGAVEPAQNPNP